MSESAQTPTTLDTDANINNPAIYPPSENPGGHFAATDAPKTYTSNGTMMIPEGGSTVAFGTGVLGAVQITADDLAYAGVHDYTTFKLAAGATLRAPPGRGILIRATTSIEIDGILDVVGQVVNTGTFLLLYGSVVTGGSGGGGGGGGSSTSNGQNGNNGQGGGGGGGGQLGFLNPTSGMQGNGGNGGAIGAPGTAGTAGTPGVVNGPNPVFGDTTPVWPCVLMFFDGGGIFGADGQDGGQGGDGGNFPGSGGASGLHGMGGAGAGFIMLSAPSIVIGPTAVIRAHGLPGTAATAGANGAAAAPASNNGGGGGGGGGSGGQGGTGGVMLMYYIGTNGIVVDPAATFDFVGGAGAPGAAGGLGGAGDGGGAAGANGTAGALGVAGVSGLVVQTPLLQ